MCVAGGGGRGEGGEEVWSIMNYVGGVTATRQNVRKRQYS